MCTSVWEICIEKIKLIENTYTTNVLELHHLPIVLAEHLIGQQCRSFPLVSLNKSKLENKKNQMLKMEGVIGCTDRRGTDFVLPYAVA